MLHPTQGIDLLTDGFYSDVGFIHAIRPVLQLKESSLAYFALPCNSFGFMSFATHKPTVCNPFGNVHHKFVCVCVGNIFGTRMVLLVMVAACRGLEPSAGGIAEFWIL